MSLYTILGDLHLPWVNQRNLDLALDVIEDLGCDHIILNGDVADFYNLNAHGPKHPDIKTKLDDEFIAVEDFLSYLRKRFKDVNIVWVWGNHEYRLDRYVVENCPAFYNHLRLENLLDLQSLGIKHIPYNERYQISANLFVQHSPPSYSTNLASTSLMKKIDQDHIWNCAHRTDMAVRTGMSGNVYTSYINGWFGDTGVINQLQRAMPENRRVYSFTKGHESWNCSFTLASVYGDVHHVQQVIIKDYACAVGNNLYRG